MLKLLQLNSLYRAPGSNHRLCQGQATSSKTEKRSKRDSIIKSPTTKQKKTPPSSKYKHTIFLPSTKFPNFVKDIPKHEQQLQKVQKIYIS